MHIVLSGGKKNFRLVFGPGKLSLFCFALTRKWNVKKEYSRDFCFFLSRKRRDYSAIVAKETDNIL